jgi:monoamine oxidase
MGALVEKLTGEVDRSLRLRHVVHDIRWRRGSVDVTASSATRTVAWRARAAVVTAPLGVLKAPRGAEGAIRFDPEPARIRKALERLAVGSVIRVPVAFRRFPWERDDDHAPLSFLHLARGPFQVWWTAYPRRWPLAVAWSGGPAAKALARRGRAEVVKAVYTELAHALHASPRRVRDQIRKTWWHDWDGDPFTRGAYSYPRVGGTNAARVLAHPEAATLFFAGEATHPEGGTIEAALASGQRAARQLAGALAKRRSRR